MQVPEKKFGTLVFATKHGPVTDAANNTDPADAAPAPAADTHSVSAAGVTPVEAAASAPSTETPEATDKPSSTEASPPPPAYESVV